MVARKRRGNLNIMRSLNCIAFHFAIYKDYKKCYVVDNLLLTMQISEKKDPSINSSKNHLKALNWQERRKIERERKQIEEDEQN
jgi:hypothetical protein